MLAPRITPAPAATSSYAWWALLLPAAAAWIVFSGALPYFFAQDDFAGLARARGLLPRLAGPWRYLSGQTYFDVMSAAAGLRPAAYHAVSLIAHATAASLLLVFLARRLSLPAAIAGAVSFAAHPMFFTAIYSISGIGEILSLVFVLAALLALESAGNTRWLALPFFALSLLCKESTLLLPLAAVAIARWPGGDRPSTARGAAPVIATLAILALAYGISFVAGNTFSVRQALPESAAYSMRFDATLLENALTYLGWTLNTCILTVASFDEKPDPITVRFGVGLVVLWVAGLAWPKLQRRGWLAGGILYLALLIPVLPLRNHTYHYYLYAPLAGAAWCFGAFVDALVTRDGARGRQPAGRLAWAVSVAIAFLLVANGLALVRKIENAPFLIGVPELRSDPTVDRARIARNTYEGLRASELPPGVRLRFWSPASLDLQRQSGNDPAVESYWERNVRAALMDGLGVRVLFPAVRDVEFVRAFTPAPDSIRYAVYLLDGRLRVAPSAELESVLRSVPDIQ